MKSVKSILCAFAACSVAEVMLMLVDGSPIVADESKPWNVELFFMLHVGVCLLILCLTISDGSFVNEMSATRGDRMLFAKRKQDESVGS